MHLKTKSGDFPASHVSLPQGKSVSNVNIQPASALPLSSFDKPSATTAPQAEAASTRAIKTSLQRVQHELRKDFFT